MRKKLQRFSDNAVRYNVIELGKEKYETIKGKWADHFENANPITVELGCGRGEYTVGLAADDHSGNYVGIDIKGSRIWVGSTIAMDNNLRNVAFLRTHVQNVDQFFDAHEVSCIWITFPDPRPRDRDEKRRLTNPKLMTKYRHMLKPDGWIKFKTDNTELFDYTLEMIRSGKIATKNLIFTHDLYNSPLLVEHNGLQTKYEKIFSEKGETIKYMKFQFSD